MLSADEQITRLERGCERIYTLDELRQKLITGRRLRVKLGMDPTAPDLTLGHTVVLQKMRQFQDLGHLAVLIIGDFTAMIGDPTGRSKTRPMLSHEDIDANAQTYLQQAGKVLDLAPDKLEIRRNSEWLAPMKFADVIRLAAKVTTARMLERDTFAKRQAEGKEIFLHELFYPLVQGQDSVAIHSDVELGGSDQTFNNLVGRDLQRQAGQEPQVVVIMPLLVGIDGVEKMSKSVGNYVGVTHPPSEMFARIMSIPDATMKNYYELLTDLAPEDIAARLDPQHTHPRDAKVALGKYIVTRFHSAAEADAAEQEFFRIHGKGKEGLPDDIADVHVPASMFKDGEISAAELTVHVGFASSKSDARRLIAEAGVRLNGDPLKDPVGTIAIKTGDILQRGKRRFVRLILS
ncbi:MAG TPA: tyrosine--tRNA ligase [Phycisphaerae bacterium]